jgi:hypothetical protein
MSFLNSIRIRVTVERLAQSSPAKSVSGQLACHTSPVR